MRLMLSFFRAYRWQTLLMLLAQRQVGYTAAHMGTDLPLDAESRSSLAK